MMVWKVPFNEFRTRVLKMQRKHPDHPVRYFEGIDKYILYWTDDDLQCICSEIPMSTFRERIEEENFKNDFLRGATQLSEPHDVEPEMEEEDEPEETETEPEDLLEPVTPYEEPDDVL